MQVAATSDSCGHLLGRHHSLQGIDIVAAGKIDERLIVGRSIGDERLQDLLHNLWRLVSLDVLIKFARDRSIYAISPANEDVIAVDGVSVVVHGHPRANQSYVADVMLRAGVMTSGEMNIDRRLKLHPLLTPCRDLVGILLGVRGGETTTRGTGA